MNEKIDSKYFGRRSTDDTFNIGPFDARTDAVEGTKKKLYLQRGNRFFTGQLTQWNPVIDVGYMFDQLNCEAKAECGEIADSWLMHVTAKEKEELEMALSTVITGWLQKTGHWPEFGSITQEQEHVVL